MISVSCYVELGTTFPTGLYVRLAKTDQPAHSNRSDQSLVSAWRRFGSCAAHTMHSEGFDQTAHQTARMRSLIRVFAERTCNIVGKAVPLLTFFFKPAW